MLWVIAIKAAHQKVMQNTSRAFHCLAEQPNCEISSFVKLSKRYAHISKSQH